MISAEELSELTELIGRAHLLKPVVKAGIEAVEEYGEEAGAFLEKIRSYFVASKIKSIRQFEEAGFSKEEAILLTIDQSAAISRLSKSLKDNHNKSK